MHNINTNGMYVVLGIESLKFREAHLLVKIGNQKLSIP